MYTCWHATKIVPFLDLKARYADFLLVLVMLAFYSLRLHVSEISFFIRIFFTLFYAIEAVLNFVYEHAHIPYD